MMSIIANNNTIISNSINSNQNNNNYTAISTILAKIRIKLSPKAKVNKNNQQVNPRKKSKTIIKAKVTIINNINQTNKYYPRSNNY